MKKFMYVFGTAALAVAMSGVPTIAAHAEAGEDGLGGLRVNANVNVESNTEASAVHASTSASVGVGENESFSEGQPEQRRTSATSTGNRPSIVGISGEGEIEVEDDNAPPVSSLSELKQTIEARKLQLEQVVASTSPKDQNIVQNANQVHLAVHALVASRNLLGTGGIGAQVSQIARSINNSVASTTNAEAQIQSRGFFSRLLFGGDSAAANTISQAVAQNQQDIATLTSLLAQANVSVDMQTTLKAQIAAIQDAQVKLQALAQSEKSQWGLFSWRF